jgi:carbamoyl-phosphate synthase large subunit
LPNQLAPHLARLDVPLLGHLWRSIDQAEDRKKFSALLDGLKIDQPRWVDAKSQVAIEEFVHQVGFPILVRPSYVLSGAAMSVAVDQETLKAHLSRAQEISSEHPVILSEYFDGAKEVELDGVAQRGRILATAISEHIENAGVHSGDATLVFPSQNLEPEILGKVQAIGVAIAQALILNGPFNIQFLVKGGRVFVIECNVRASRSFPFVSKVSGENFIALATEAILDTKDLPAVSVKEPLKFLGVKSAMFSFQRLAGADPVLGVEMASTGEVACLGTSVDEALLLSLQSSGVKPPQKGVLISAGRMEEKARLIDAVDILCELKIPLYATPGTAQFFRRRGLILREISWDSVGSTMIKLIQENALDFVINIPKDYSESELSRGYQVRTLAVRHGCTLMTNVEKTDRFLKALKRKKNGDVLERVFSLALACQGFC